MGRFTAERRSTFLTPKHRASGTTGTAGISPVFKTARCAKEPIAIFVGPGSGISRHASRPSSGSQLSNSSRQAQPANPPAFANRSNPKGLSRVPQSCRNRAVFVFPESPNIDAHCYGDRGLSTQSPSSTALCSSNKRMSRNDLSRERQDPTD